MSGRFRQAEAEAAPPPPSNRGAWFSALTAPSSFRSDSRFDAVVANARPEPAAEPQPEPVTDDVVTAEPIVAPLDPVALAFTEGFSAGVDQARAEAAEKFEEHIAARDELALSFAKIDRVMEEEMRLRLRETVAALCEQAILPLTLDPDLLAKRVQRAVAMLARADDERIIRLHPEDIAMISPSFAKDWTVEADSTLERGAIRVEGLNGGVEDGPATWRRAIAEALHQV
jgi:flagellar assembly protein FliH